MIGKQALEAKMLICPRCQIEYRERSKLCSECGSPLVPKEKPSFTPMKKDKNEDGNLGGPFICLNCNLVYEFGEFCVQCGSSLGTKNKESISVFTRGRDEAPLQIISSKGEWIEKPKPLKRLICPNCKLLYERSTSCIRCGSALAEEIPSKEMDGVNAEPQPHLISEMEKESPPVQKLELKSEEALPTYKKEVEGETSQIEKSGPPPVHKSTPEMITRIKRPGLSIKKIRNLSFQIGSFFILMIAVGYLLWSVYSSIAAKQSKSDSSKEFITSIPSGPSPLSHPPMISTPSPSQSPYLEIEEIESIKNILRNIQQANLKKDIDLFMSCYSTQFKDRDAKRKSTLEDWKKFNYISLSYDFKTHSISGDAALVRVEWFIRFALKDRAQPQESRTLLDVKLNKEKGGWKIKEIIPIN
jgi:rRNA maturation endonuclease Nob1/ketosteroid isomerase-like protein